MNNLYKAIAKFKNEVPVILKDTSGHNYKYADLPQIDEVIKPLLEKYNLGIIQPLAHIVVGDNIVPAIKTTIFETETGESISETHPLPELKMVEVTQKKGEVTSTKYVVAGMEQMSLPQANGSMITYYRRYCLSSFLGLITDKDNDGAGSKGAEHDLF